MADTVAVPELDLQDEGLLVVEEAAGLGDGPLHVLPADPVNPAAAEPAHSGHLRLDLSVEGSTDPAETPMGDVEMPLEASESVPG